MMPSNAISRQSAQSLAERFRAARERFELGCKMGCTPAEAQTEIDRQHARARWEDTNRRLEARRAARNTTPTSNAPEAAPTRAPWWLND